MILLRKLSEFGAPREDLKIIYISYIRSILEQSAVVWHTSLTEENKEDLGRVKKTSVKIILKEKYKYYPCSLEILDIEDLNTRREQLCKAFAQRCVKNDKILFEQNDKLHHMTTRHKETFNVSFCNTDRLEKSAIPQKQRILNKTSHTKIA